MTTVAINGFGRIGRSVLRALHESGADDLEIVAIGDLPAHQTGFAGKHELAFAAGMLAQFAEFFV